MFALRDLSVLAYAAGFTLWHYKARQVPLAAIDAPGFFAAAGDLLAAGDMIMVSAASGGRIVAVTARDGALRIERLVP